MPPWYKRTLSAEDALGRASAHLEDARNTKDKRRAMKLCDEAKEALERIDISKSIKNQDRIAAAYREHGNLLEKLGFSDETQFSYNKANGLRKITDQSPPALSLSVDTAQAPTMDISAISISAAPAISTMTHNESVMSTVFTKDCPSLAIPCSLPGPDERLTSTRQLACCLALLQAPPSSLDSLDSSARAWLKVTATNQDEKDRLGALATDLIRALARDELKDRMAISEVVCLAPVLEKRDFRSLLSLFVNSIKDSLLLDVHALEGLALLIQNAAPGYMDADDLVKILELLSTRLQETFQQSPQHIYKLTITVSRVLDAMADSNIQGLDRVKLHEPLLSYLDGLKSDKNPYIVYQAAYAYQALLCVPDDEEPWQAALRRSGAIIKGVGGLASAIKGLNIAEFINGLSTIQEGFQGATQIFGLIQDAYSGVAALKESGQGLLDSLKNGLSFSHKRAWYAALRGADALIQNGELTKFKTLVYEAPCRRDLAFQLGICQRLGYLATDPTRDDDCKSDAIAFLREIYWNDAEWGQEACVKQCILDILLQLSQAPAHGTRGSIRTAVGKLLKDLATDGDNNKQSLYIACIQSGPSQHSWKATTPPSHTTNLIDQIQNKPSVEPALRKYQRRRLQEQEQRHSVYIPPQAKATRESSDEDLFDLTAKVNQFITEDGEGKVLLLLGDSGAGKSTFNLELEKSLWKAYNTDKKWIPVFVTLPAIDKPEKDLIAKQLRNYDFTEDQIRELKSYRQFVLICDGYDECQKKDNLYNDNRLNQPGEWKVKMVISCRSEFLGSDYRVFFQPGGRNDRRATNQLQEAVVAPFTMTKISDYILSYVANYKPEGDTNWKAEDYESAIESIPNLQELVRNPFLLSLALDVLPRLVDLSKDFTSSKISRVTLYDQFVEQWIERGQIRLIERSLTGEDHTAFEILSEDGFTRNAISFLKDLAVAIFDMQDGRPVVEYSPIRDKASWKASFFGHGDGKNLLRETCPLSRNGNQFRFIHRSVLEYGLVRAVFEPDSSEVDSDASVEHLDVLEPHNEEELFVETPLFRKSFIHEPSIINFLSERVHQSIQFRNQLLGFVEMSKADDRFSLAAANAITILVRAGINFNGADLNGIRIPGADLSHGQFDHAKLQGADLRNTKLRSVWLRHADLSHSRMDGADFGEWPYLDTESEVNSCAFSADGKLFAIACNGGYITVFESESWTTLYSLGRHSGYVLSVAFSPNGQQIASGGRDGIDRREGTVRLWDTQPGATGLVLESYSEPVNVVAYSPDGLQIANGSDDGAVQLWNTQTRMLGLTLSGHAISVKSISFSPNGQWIAAGSYDGTIRLWDARTGRSGLTLNTDGCIFSVAFSPDGRDIASGGEDKILRVWDSNTGMLRFSSSPYSTFIRGVSFSPDGHQLALCCDDGTVHLKDAHTGVFGSTLDGHNDWVTCIAYSPNGQKIVSGSHDKTVRIWDAQAGTTNPTLSGPVVYVILEVKSSPNGQEVASRDAKGIVRLWDTQPGTPGPILSLDNGCISAMAHSPSGEKMACGGGGNTGMLNLWDTRTGAMDFSIDGHTGWVRYVTYSPDGSYVASADSDTLRLWNVKNSEPGFHFEIPVELQPDMMGIAFSPCSQQIACCGDDYIVGIWDIQTGKLDATLKGHTDLVRIILFSPNGQQMATCSIDATVRLWDAKTGEAYYVFQGISWRMVDTLEYSPCGQYIALGARTIEIRDTNTGELRLDPLDDGDFVQILKYSPSGRQLASISNRRKCVRVWDSSSGEVLAVLEGFSKGVSSVSWISDSSGTYLVTGCSAGSVRLWQLVEDNGDYRIQLCWSTPCDTLVVMNTFIQDVQGLSDTNLQLLKQRGSVGTPDSLSTSPS